MHKSTFTLFALACITAAALAQTPAPAPETPAAEPGPGAGRGRPPRMGRAAGGAREFGSERMIGSLLANPQFADQLQLTEAQREAIRKVGEAQRATVAELQKTLADNARKQADLMLTEPLDEAALMALVEETGAARTALAKAGLTTMIEMRKVLTPEQRLRLGTLAGEMRARWDRSAAGRGDGMSRERNRKPAADAEKP